MHKKCCYECNRTESDVWHQHTTIVDDPYGMACSEDGVSTVMEIDIDICDSCQELADAMDDAAIANY